MACYTCKNKTSIEVTGENKTNIFLRILYFLIGVMVVIFVTPILGLVGIYMLFNTMVLNKSTEIMPSLTILADLMSKIRRKDIDEEDDEEENLNPDDYELIGVEEIKTKYV